MKSTIDSCHITAMKEEFEITMEWLLEEWTENEFNLAVIFKYKGFGQVWLVQYARAALPHISLLGEKPHGRSIFYNCHESWKLMQTFFSL